MSNYLDIDNWNRRDLYHLFRKYENPFFNICADVDVTDTVEYTRKKRFSFFIVSLYMSIKVANEIEEFRYRIQGERIRIHDVIHPGSTVLNDDETFSFCYFEYQTDFAAFYESAQELLRKHKHSLKTLDPQWERDDLIHYSVIPWISFRSFSHAKRFGTMDSVPKVVFGKYYDEGSKLKMPVSVEVHHALMDGIHVGRFFERFQEVLNRPNHAL